MNLGRAAVALAALAAVTGVVLVAPRAQVEPPSTPVIVAWAAALAAPLVLRHRWPLVVLAVTILQFTRYWAVGQVNEIASWVILGVAIYSAARPSPTCSSWWVSCAGRRRVTTWRHSRAWAAARAGRAHAPSRVGG